MNISSDFEPIDNPFQTQVLEHHAGFAPVLLKSIHNAVESYWIWCPECGYKVPGSTIEAVISNWNDNITDPRRSVETPA